MHTKPDKLTRVRNLKRATKNLVLREAYNTDLPGDSIQRAGHPRRFVWRN
ncbi:MAG: hypothetical protein U0361_01975 [Nitrospiraceae bacterium]